MRLFYWIDQLDSIYLKPEREKFGRKKWREKFGGGKMAEKFGGKPNQMRRIYWINNSKPHVNSFMYFIYKYSLYFIRIQYVYKNKYL